MYDWVWTRVPLVTYKPQGVKQVSGRDEGISYFTKDFFWDRWDMNINWHKCIILLGFCLIQALVKWYVLMPFYICRPQMFGWKIALKACDFYCDCTTEGEFLFLSHFYFYFKSNAFEIIQTKTQNFTLINFLIQPYLRLLF